MSRTFVCPARKPSAEQGELYELARDQVSIDAGLLRPGLSFRKFAERCRPVPDAFAKNRYMMMVYGVGMVDEYLTGLCVLGL